MSEKFRYALGCLPDAPDERDQLVATAAFTLPEKVDWTGLMPAVRDQGTEGTCVGHAVAALKEFQERRQYQRPFDFSERFVYEYAKRYDEWEGEDYEGTSIRGAMKAMKKRGICEEKLWPYVPRRIGRPDPRALNNAWQYRIGAYRSLTYYDQGAGKSRVNLAAVKRALAESGPLAIGMEIYGQDWFEVGADGLIEDSGSGVYQGGHAICLVAYDDARQRFAVRNSWGEKWGRGGYGVFSYDFMLKYCHSAWSAWDV